MRNAAGRMTGSAWALVLGASLSLGCSGDDDDDGAVRAQTGTVEFNWTIAGETEPELCERFGVASFDAVLIDEGYAVSRFEIPCEEFTGNVELYADDYAVRTTLIDGAGYRVTDRIVTSRFVLYPDEAEVIDVNFPESSFTGGGGSAAGGAAEMGGQGGMAGEPSTAGEAGEASAAGGAAEAGGAAGD